MGNIVPKDLKRSDLRDIFIERMKDVQAMTGSHIATKLANYNSETFIKKFIKATLEKLPTIVDDTRFRILQ
jgi:hypothetical protein